MTEKMKHRLGLWWERFISAVFWVGVGSVIAGVVYALLIMIIAGLTNFDSFRFLLRYYMPDYEVAVVLKYLYVCLIVGSVLNNRMSLERRFGVIWKVCLSVCSLWLLVSIIWLGVDWDHFFDLSRWGFSLFVLVTIILTYAEFTLIPMCVIKKRWMAYWGLWIFVLIELVRISDRDMRYVIANYSFAALDTFMCLIAAWCYYEKRVTLRRVLSALIIFWISGKWLLLASRFMAEPIGK